MKQIIYIFSIILVIILNPKNILSKERIYFQFGEGGIDSKYPIISPLTYLTSISSHPAFSDEQFNQLPLLFYEKDHILKTEHYTVGYEKEKILSNMYIRFGFTHSKYEVSPYNLPLEFIYFDRNFNRDISNINILQKIFLYSAFLLSTEFSSREVVSNIRFETTSIETGLKYDFNLWKYVGTSIGTDVGLGICTIRESCISYTISPFVGLNLIYGDINFSFIVMQRYIWLEFGIRSLNLNIKGEDTYIISIIQEVDF